MHYQTKVVYSRVTIASEKGSDDSPLWRINEETVLRLSDRGRVAERRYQGQRVLEAETLHPLYASRTVVQDGLLEQHTLTRLGDTRQEAAAVHTMRSEATLAAVPLETRELGWDDARDVLMDDLSPADWMILCARFEDLREPRTLRAYVPRERERVALALVPSGKGSLKFSVQAQTARLAWDEQGRLVRMDAPELGYKLERANAAVLHATGALEVLSGLTVASPLPAERMANMVRLQLRLAAETYGEELTADDLQTAQQRFEGSVSPTRVDGVCTLSPRVYHGENAPGMNAKLDPALERYTRAEVGIESDHPRIVETASSVTQGARDAWEAAVRCGHWVHANIRGDLLVQGSALTGLCTGLGAAGTGAKLCVALCRAAGVPARQAGGLVLLASDFVPHYWCEVHMGDAGWIPIDPVLDRYSRLPAGYLTFVHLGGMRRIASLELVAAQDRKEPDMPLLPAAPEMLLRCPAQSYQFIVNEKIIGESRLRPLGRVEMSGKPSFAFAMETQLDSRPVGKDYVVRAEARLYLDAAGLPVYYVFQDNVAGRITQATCDFGPDAGVLHWKGAGESAELPMAKTPATCILDRNMIGAWALLARRLPRAVGEVIGVHALVPSQPVELASTVRCTRTAALPDGAVAYLYDTEPMGETLWIDEDGTLLGIENPRVGLSIRLMEEKARES